MWQIVNKSFFFSHHKKIRQVIFFFYLLKQIYLNNFKIPKNGLKREKKTAHFYQK